MKILLLSNMEFGIMVSIIGYLIVLSDLAFLVGVYTLLPKLLDTYTRAKLRRQGKHCAEKGTLDITGEESAVIAVALHYILSEHHDLESGTITIKKISKRYSPWSSKIYSMNNYKR